LQRAESSRLGYFKTSAYVLLQVLLRSCDEHKETHAEAHLRVFWTFATCINSWLKGEDEEGQDEFENDDENEVAIEPSIGAAERSWRSVEFLVEYHKNVVQAEEDVDMSDNDDTPGESDNVLPPSKQPHLLAQQLRSGTLPFAFKAVVTQYRK